MSAALPDVSVTDTATTHGPLQWVGMQGIDLPITVDEAGYRRELHARADVQVDLPAPQVKGIHMSRLYTLLDEWSQASSITPSAIRTLLEQMVASHRDCESRNARLGLDFNLLVRRHALVTKGLAGWKSYPVQVEALLNDNCLTLNAKVKIAYSSTCPCSAALSRQLLREGFEQAFSDLQMVDPNEVSMWLRRHGSLATPHSQRSEAWVSTAVAQSAPDLGLMEMINRVESALGTPVQTAVKRADEQAFAALNGSNLMFVEDAARRIQAALSDLARVKVHVRHLESLHPHDAAAWSGEWEGTL